MTHELKNSKYSGKFTIAPGKEVHGKLTLAGEDSCLDVWSNNVHDVLISEITGTVTGVLHNSGKSVSIISCCLVDPVYQKENKYFVRIGANLILIGDDHFRPDKDTVCEVSMVIDDATVLFPDVSTDGKVEIFVANTKLGKISASRTNILDPLGILDDVERDMISVNLRPVKTCFKEIMERTLYKIQGLLGLLIGRPQNIVELTIATGPSQAPLQVYVHRLPEYRRFKNTEHRPDSLINATQQPKEFARILENWFERDDTWHEARRRFFNNVGPQYIYSEVRLIIVANLFDILPDNAIPSKIKLSAELECARDQCKSIFKKLKEKTPERARLLDALGRIGQSSLREKINYRNQLLIDQIGDQIPDIDTVIKEAVECRNHYVHGSKDSRIDYSKNRGTEVFLTETLEFVFVTSDLIDSGWNIKKWWQDCHDPYYDHPFAMYLNSYEKQLQEFNSLPKKAKNSSC